MEGLEGFGVQDVGLRARKPSAQALSQLTERQALRQGLGFRVLGFGFWVLGLGTRVGPWFLFVGGFFEGGSMPLGFGEVDAFCRV